MFIKLSVRMYFVVFMYGPAPSAQRPANPNQGCLEIGGDRIRLCFYKTTISSHLYIVTSIS